MATYTLAQQLKGVGQTYGFPPVHAERISLPDLCTLLGISAFANADVIEAFGVHEGFLAYCVVLKVITGEGAVATFDFGVTENDDILGNLDVDCFLDGADLQTAGTEVITLVGNGGGADAVMGILFSRDTTADILLATATAYETAVFDLSLVGWETKPTNIG